MFIFLQSNYPMYSKKRYSTKRVEHNQFSSKAIVKVHFIFHQQISGAPNQFTRYPLIFPFTLVFSSHYHTTWSQFDTAAISKV